MKSFILLVIAAFLLISCASAPIPPTATSSPLPPTGTSTLTPTSTPKPTSTPRPTVTVTPSLPETIELTFDPFITEETQRKIRIAVDEAYWYYVKLGCSPDGLRAKFYIGDSGGAAGYKRGVFFEAGLSKPDKLSSQETSAISHEMVHAMCQLQFTKIDAMGAVDLRWLTEGVANYFSTMEQIQNTGMNSGSPFSNIKLQDRVMAENVHAYCDVPISKLEPANAQDLYPPSKVYAIADVATRLLVKTTPDGISAVIKYYTLLPTDRKYKAFEDAFGRTTDEFYQEYQEECLKGFPSVVNK